MQTDIPDLLQLVFMKPSCQQMLLKKASFIKTMCPVNHQLGVIYIFFPPPIQLHTAFYKRTCLWPVIMRGWCETHHHQQPFSRGGEYIRPEVPNHFRSGSAFVQGEGGQVRRGLWWVVITGKQLGTANIPPPCEQAGLYFCRVSTVNDHNYFFFLDQSELVCVLKLLNPLRQIRLKKQTNKQNKNPCKTNNGNYFWI